MQEYPLHGAVWAKELVQELKQRGFPVADVLRGLDVEPRVLNAEDAKIPIDKIVSIFEAAAELSGDESTGFHFAQSREPRSAGLLTYVGMSSPTLGDSVVNLHRYGRVFTDAIDLDISKFYEEGWVEYDWRLPASVMRRQHTEWAATMFVQTLRKLTGRNIWLDGLTFRYPRNSNVAEYEKFFGCPIKFGALKNRVQFRLEDLEAPLTTADSRLHRILRKYCEVILSQSKTPKEGLSNSVERLVADRLSKNEATLENVATELGMSSRTLSRRLANEGSSFKGIVENYRRAISDAYLKDDDLNITQIAFLLGYNEVSSFNHACKRWTGKTPSEIRRLA